MPNWKDVLKRPARRSAADVEKRQEPADSRQPVTAPAAAGGTPPTEQTAPEPAPAQQQAEEPAREPAKAEQAAPAQPVKEPAKAEQAAPAQPVKEPAPRPVDEPAEKPVKKEAPVAKTTQENKAENKGDRKAEKKEREPGRGRDTGKKVVAGANALRTRIASIVWLVAVICAAVLAVAALMVALGMNPQNAVVSFITNLADALFPFQSFKTFTGHGAHTKEILTNYGLMAIIYLVVGKILDRIIRP